MKPKTTAIAFILGLSAGVLATFVMMDKDRQSQGNADRRADHPQDCQRMNLAGGTMATSNVATTATSPATTYPSSELTLACQNAADAIKTKLDDKFSLIVCPPFIVAGDMNHEMLKKYIDACVTGPADAMYASYFKVKPDKPITILLFSTDKSYRSWAQKLFNDNDVSHFGYYKPNLRTMVMNISTGGGTLIHELTHSLIVYDFPNVPTWFNEGLASLHEGCRVGKDEISGDVNWRLPGLQKAIADKTLRRLAEMISTDDFYDRLCGMNYAQSRYFIMYVQSLGKLKDLYAAMRKGHKSLDGDVKIVEDTLGKPIARIEKDYIAWVKTLRFR